MPRRRPPGTGPGLSTTLLTILLVLPWISTAAQQQQPPRNGYRGSPREEARVDTIIPRQHTKPSHSKNSNHIEVISQNERALATRAQSSAPGAVEASVRAPSVRDAAASGGLSSPLRARSLQDWEVEDFVLLATVDGHLHAKRRENGLELWDLDAGRPMVETIYHTTNESTSDEDAAIQPFLWIVEPAENGKLYMLSPGPQPSLHNLGLTVKQLAEELSPYSANNPPVVYTAEKKSTLFVVEANSGRILKQFSSAGSSVVDAQSCEPRATGFAGSSQLQCRGTFTIGQTEYTIKVQEMKTAQTICTIKYFEWTPNNRDRDLKDQYQSTMDNKYVYSKFDGEIIGIDHTGDKNLKLKRPMYKKKLSSPVARVFDVARPFDDDDPEAPLVILPQPAGPAKEEEGLHDVWLNTTNSGSWYALSEREYPAVTDGAEEARCYKLDYNLLTYNGEPLLPEMAYNGEHLLPDRDSLVGVHSLDRNPSPLPLSIAGSIAEQPSVPSGVPPAVSTEEPEPVIHPKTGNTWWAFLVTCFVIIAGLGSWLGKPSTFEFVKGKVLVHLPQVETAKIAPPLPAQTETKAVEAEAPAIDAPAATEASETTDVAPPEIKEQRRVKFDIPDDEDEDELEPLSRSTTFEEASGDQVDAAGNPILSGTAENGENEGVSPSTPVKKKKTHRGKRGSGRKKREQREMDEVSKIVNAAKQLDQTPPLHPDEQTMVDDDVQDVTNIKRIGKLTIDFDRVLGNGSGGTFVFEGKWNVSFCRGS